MGHSVINLVNALNLFFFFKHDRSESIILTGTFWGNNMTYE